MQKTKGCKHINDETGASALITALVLTIVLTAAAMTVDIGSAYIDSSEAQNSADAIALSVGRHLPVKDSDEIKKSSIISEAMGYAQKNGICDKKKVNIEFCGLKDGKYEALNVKVKKTYITKLAGIIGVDSIEVEKSATVSAKPAGKFSGAIPIGITEETYDYAIRTGNTENVVLKVGGGDGSNGFYGFVVLDDSSGNANILEKWMKYGYEGENYVGQQLPVATGNKTSVAMNGVEYRLSLCEHFIGYGGCNTEHYNQNCGRIVCVLVYRFIDDRVVEVVGFTPFLLEQSEQQDEIQGSFIDINISYSDSVSDKDFGTYTYRLTE